jgi:hypothetical protein
MAHMQTGTGWVREHVEYIKFGLRRIGADLEGAVRFPVSLPSGFNFPEVVFHGDVDFCRR